MQKKFFIQIFLLYKFTSILENNFDYWFGQKGDEAVIAAIDCTGHGVPGALMTVIGNSLLNQIVTSGGIMGPSNILTQLDSKLHETLKQHGNIITKWSLKKLFCSFAMKKCCCWLKFADKSQ